MPHSEPERKAANSRWWGCAGAVGFVALLLTCAVLYWQYANTLPPERAAPVPMDAAVAASLKPAEQLVELRGLLFTSPPPTLPVIASAKERALLQQIRRSFPIFERAKSLGDDSSNRRGLIEFSNQAFAVESRLMAKRGDIDASLSSALDAVELGCVAARGNGVSDRYLAQSCQMNGLEEIERLYPKLLNASRPGIAAQLSRLRRLRQTWPRLQQTLVEEHDEQWSACRTWLQVMNGKGPLERYEHVSKVVDDPWFTLGTIELKNYFDFPAWGQALTPHRLTLAEVDRYYDKLIAASSRPAPHGVTVPKVSNTFAEPYCDSSFSRQYRGEWARHNLAITEVAMAVQVHRMDHNRFPKSLSEIPPSILPEVPVDVWDQPVHYRLKKGKPLVYSLGADGKDEGGKAVDPSTHIRSRGGDLVFGRLGNSHWVRVPD
jgi:hypothetical protein